MEELKAKQKKEIKAFEGEKRNALKKIKGTAGKGKKGKEAFGKAETEWKEKERKMFEHHSAELASLSSATPVNDATLSSDQGLAQQQETNAREKAIAKKAKKRQDQRDKERAREAQIAEERAMAGPSPRDVEISQIMELYLGPQGLEIEEILSDGNCLYRAVAVQLSTIVGNDESGGYEKMRELCADTLNNNREEFEPFADLEDQKVSNFDEYIGVVRNSNEWGGHLELRALAIGLKRTIVVYSADSAPLRIDGNEGDQKLAEETSDENLIRLSFHRNYYALGEHYNSIVTVNN